MNKKNIENLVLWLLIAGIISSFYSPITLKYLTSLFTECFIKGSSKSSSNILFGLTPGDLVLHSVLLGTILSKLVNVVVAVWLYGVVKSKRALWVALGLFSGLWALPLFAYYYHFATEAKDESASVQNT
jgi:hypothetical protein